MTRENSSPRGPSARGQALKTVIRIILVLAMILEGIVALGHLGDLNKQSTEEWAVLEILVVLALAGTIILFRFVGSHWETMPVWGKFLVTTPVLASLWFIGPAIAFVALAIATIAFVIYLFKNGYMSPYD